MVDNITLEMLKIGRRTLMDMSTLRESLEFQSYIEYEMNRMVCDLRAYVLAEEIDCRSKVVSITLTFPVYQSWWQHFKGEILPKWLKKRFPPKFNYVTRTGKKIVTFRKLATYPKAYVTLPELGDTIVYRNQITEEPF